MTTAIVWVTLPLDQAVLLQLVEDPDQLAPVEVERIGDLRLRVPGALVEESQDCVMVRVAPGGDELGHRALANGVAEALEQEDVALEELLRKARDLGGIRRLGRG